MAQALYQFTVPTPSQLLANMLRTYANGMIAIGVANPNVSKGSDVYVLFQSIANELSAAYANAVIKSDATMPDTASGTDLDRWLSAVGLARDSASGSAGLVVLNSSLTTGSGVFIPIGSQLTDTLQLRYQVTVGGSYLNGQYIPVASIDIGAQTDHANGDVLAWVTPPPYCASTVLVGTTGGTDGLTGGADAEQDGAARARLLATMSNPPSAGNWQAVSQLGQASTPQVEMCFVYPALQGPATTTIVCTSRATATNRTRTLATLVMTTQVTPYVAGLLPEYVYLQSFTPVSVPTDVALLLSIPSAPTASPPGPGGGWIDGTPWPQSIGGTAPCVVTGMTTTSNFTVNATTAPTAGASSIAYLDPTTWTIYSATVVTVSGTSGAYVITTSAPLVNLAMGSAIWPQSTNQATYVAALLGAFAAMGPGEMSSNALITARAFRHPSPAQAWPSSLGASQLKAVISAGQEVLDAEYIYRSTTTPAVSVNVTTAPNILTPRVLAFYAA